MKKRTFFCLLIACTFSASPLFAAQEYLIGVGDYEYYPYHSYSDKEGYSGFARELLDTFAQKQNIRFKYKAMPWKRVVNEYVEAKLDFVFPDNSHWDTDQKKGKKVYYSQPAVQYIDGVMVLPKNKGRGLGKLKTLGTMRGFTAWDYYDQINSGQIELLENSNFIPLLKQVIFKRIDGAYIETSVARYILNEKMKKPNALVFDQDLPHTTDFYYLSTIKHPKIIEKFNVFLSAEKDSIDQLKKKFKVGSLVNK